MQSPNIGSIIRSDKLTPQQQAEVVAIWNAEYPDYLSYESVGEFKAYLDGLTELLHYRVEEHGQTMAWLITFTREGERWIVLLVDRSAQKKGLGARLLQAAQNAESELNAWVIDQEGDLKSDGSNYPSPLAFYLKYEFDLLPAIRLNKGPLSVAKLRWTSH